MKVEPHASAYEIGNCQPSTMDVLTEEQDSFSTGDDSLHRKGGGSNDNFKIFADSIALNHHALQQLMNQTRITMEDNFSNQHLQSIAQEALETTANTIGVETWKLGDNPLFDIELAAAKLMPIEFKESMAIEQNGDYAMHDSKVYPTKLPPLFEQYLHETSKVTDALPALRISSLIPVLGVCLGSKVKVGRNSSCLLNQNYYMLLLGKSTITRKSTCLDLAVNLLEDYDGVGESSAESEKSMLTLNKTTNAKLLQMLSKNATRLWVNEEFASLMGSSQAQYNTGMLADITSLYDGNSMNCSTKTDGTIRISKPALSILGASTVGWVEEYLKKRQDQESGFLQRFLYVFAEVDPDSLSDEVSECDADADFSFIKPVIETFLDLKGEHRLKFEDGVLDGYNQHIKIRRHSVLKEDNNTLLSYFGRIYDGYFYKLSALICLLRTWEQLRHAIDQNSVGEFFEEVKINFEDCIFAMSLCDFHMANVRPFVESLSQTAQVRNEMKILQIINTKSDKTIEHSELLRKMKHDLDGKAFNACIDTMIQKEYIECRHNKQSNNGKQTKIYKLLPHGKREIRQ